MRWQRMWRIKLIGTAIMLSALIIVGGRSLAQMNRADQIDRDGRRSQRQVDDLQRAQDDLRLDIERRLVRIETYMSAIMWLVGGITLAVVAQLFAGIGKGVRIVLEQWRAAGQKSGGP